MLEGYTSNIASCHAWLLHLSHLMMNDRGPSPFHCITKDAFQVQSCLTVSFDSDMYRFFITAGKLLADEVVLIFCAAWC